MHVKKNESKYMNKKLIRITESDVRRIVKESVKRLLKENDEFTPNGYRGGI